MQVKRVFLSVAVLVILSSCSVLGGDDSGPDVEYFTVQVDSLSVPASVAATDTLSVRLQGTIGNNGCYGLERIEAERTPATVNLTVIGRFTKATACTLVIVPLDTTYKVAPPLEGPFTVTVQQPDGSEWSRTVAVEE